MISFVLLVKNGAKHLDELFEVLEKQTVKVDEMVIVDSGSTDASLTIINNLSNKTNWSNRVKLFQIKPGDFSHGGTRNFAVTKATGDIIVFLSQDALPVGQDWLKNLLAPLLSDQRCHAELVSASKPRKILKQVQDDIDTDKVAGVFGKQIPWPETNVCEKYFYSQSYPDTKRVMDKKDSENFSHQNIFFSNVNAAVKKELLLKFPFREDLIMSEDQYWGREVLRADYKIIYEPKASVWHSHNYNLKELFKRYLGSGQSQKQMGLRGNVVQKGLGTGLGLLAYLVKNKPLLLPYAVVYELVKGGAFFLGRNGILK